MFNLNVITAIISTNANELIYIQIDIKYLYLNYCQPFRSIFNSAGQIISGDATAHGQKAHTSNELDPNPKATNSLADT